MPKNKWAAPTPIGNGPEAQLSASKSTQKFGALKPRLTGNRCECGACHQRFNSVSAFDLHRVGMYGIDRHCREPSEMLAIGMSLNDGGFWIERRRGERHRKRRPHTQETRSLSAECISTTPRSPAPEVVATIEGAA